MVTATATTPQENKIVMERLRKFYAKERQPLLAVFFCFLIYITTRLWPIIKYGDRAFGYDTGIYRHYIIGYFERFGDRMVHPFGFSWLTNMLSLTGTSVDEIMFFGYFLLSVAVFFAVYFVVKRYFNTNTAIIAIFLFTTSITQFEFYQWYYFRNFLSLFFVLLSLLFFYHRSYFLVFCLIFIGVIHPISLIPLATSFFILSFFDRDKRNFLFFSLLCSFFLILIFNYQELKIYLDVATQKQLLSTRFKFGDSQELTGQFLDLFFYIKIALFYLPFGFVGLIKYASRKRILAIFAIVNLLIILFGFVFYRRFIVFIDLIFIFFAAAFLEEYLPKIKKFLIGKIIIFLFFAALAAQIFFYMYTREPLISKDDFLSMKQLNKLPYESYIMTISTHYAPWLYGFTNKKIIAPGMFEANLWNEEEWKIFWLTENNFERIELLKRYKQPLIFIYLGERDMDFDLKISSNKHFEQINQNLWKFSL